MKNDRVNARQVLAHGKAIQACLNGALVSVKNQVSGKWEPFSSNWQFYAFSEDFSYRTKVDPDAPAIESPALGNTAFDPELPNNYWDHEFTFEQVKAHGAVIQYFLRGGTTQWASEIEGPYHDMTNDYVYAWNSDFYYRIAQVAAPVPPKTSHPVEKCGCEICSDERQQETASFQKAQALMPPPFITQTVKPPLGIEPEYIWVAKRIRDLQNAVHRQLNEAGYDPDYRLVAQWSAEIVERQEQLEGINRRPKAV